jgi:hypothetical protein
VIKFERGDDEVVRMVVEKLRGFVPVGGVIFVALDDELFTSA